MSLRGTVSVRSTPDGQQILLEGKTREQEELWVIENFLPTTRVVAGE